MTSTSGQRTYLTPDHPAGILFPDFINYNYGKYYLPEVEIDKTKDPCEKKEQFTQFGMSKYQEFLQQYMRYDSPYRGILIYHGLGTGKTCTTLHIYNLLYNFSDKWNVFVLLPKVLIATWKGEFEKCITKDKEFENRKKNFIFINYDSPYANKQFMKTVKESYQNRKKSIFIIDEVHNFIRNVLSNIQSRKGRRALDIYDEIRIHKKNNKYARVICLSATPAINQPFELGLLFNMLRENTFPIKENDFNYLFQSDISEPVLKTESKNLFQRRIMGLVSYYAGARKDMFARQINVNVNLRMSEYQLEIYDIFEAEEKQMDLLRERRRKFGKGVNWISAGVVNNMYRIKTRQACNIVFPRVSTKINGETRPRPGSYRMSEGQLQRIKDKMIDGFEAFDQNKFIRNQYLEYQNALNNFLNSVRQYWMGLIDDLFENDVKNVLEFGIDKLDDFKPKSKLFTSLYTSSPKMLSVALRILESPGPVLVFSNFYRMEGLESFKVYLKVLGFVSHKDKTKKNFTYTEFHGQIKDKAERERNRLAFNEDKNFKGEFIKVILISPAGAEGINLMNVRQVHILDSYWQEVRITQVIGRAIRRCSHALWPMQERFVKVYRYFMNLPADRQSADQFVFEIAGRKNRLLQTFLNAMKEVAIDCTLFKNENILADKDYPCFKFDNESLLSKDLGYVYRKRIENELEKEGKGSNSELYDNVNVKVQRVKYVVQLKDKKTQVKLGWYDPIDSYVYDYKLKYLIGRVRFDEDGVPEMFSHDTYLVFDRVHLDEYQIDVGTEITGTSE